MRESPRRPATATDLQSIPVFAGLPTHLVEELAARAEIVRRRSGSGLFHEGERPRHLFVLIEGLAELYTGADEREPSLAIVWPPETLMPAAALTDRPYLVSCRMLGRGKILCLDAAQVREAARGNSELCFRLTTVLSGQYRMLQRNIKELHLRDAPRRLASFLYRLIEAHGAHGCADLPAPKRRLAARLGMAPESVSRALATLEENGLKVRGSRAVIMDRERLECFCAPDPLLDGPELELMTTAI